MAGVAVWPVALIFVFFAGCFAVDPCYTYRIAYPDGHEWTVPGLYDSLPGNGTLNGFEITSHGLPDHGYKSAVKSTHPHILILLVYSPGNGTHWEFERHGRAGAQEVSLRFNETFTALEYDTPTMPEREERREPDCWDSND